MDAELDSLHASQQVVFVAVTSFTVLCWDHIITFADEVDLIWCQHKTLSGYLFLLNRYITPLGFIVNIIALTLPTWSRERCRQFVRYEGAMATVGIAIAQLIMLHRVYAMYQHRKLVTALPALIFVAWLALQAYLMSQGDMLSSAQLVHSCREVYDSPLALSVTRGWLPLAYDTAVFVMTAWRILPEIWRGGVGHIRSTLLSDGALYYGVIFTVNLVLTVMILRAPPGLRGISAQLAFLLTVVMTSRVTINLKKQRDKESVIPSFIQHRPSVLGLHRVNILSTAFSGTSIPSPIDDVKSFGGKSPVHEACVDVESIYYEHIIPR